MTDKEDLLAMFGRAGITYTHGVGPGEDTGIEVTAPSRLGCVDHPPIMGYEGFVATFHFSPEGMLKQVGIWE